MNVLVVHNYYQQAGGEDEVVQIETSLLKSGGHRVTTYFRHNDELRSVRSRALVPVETLWSLRTSRELKSLLRELHPDVVHFHNTFPLVSPSAYYSCREAGVPVVQTLHNYRLLCPAANLFRDGHVCMDCVGHALPLHAITHRCYRDSVAASMVSSSMLGLHRALRTYARVVDTFIALTNFSRDKFIEGGLPAEKIVVKPNTLAGREVTSAAIPVESRNYVLYLGRFSEEKGIRTLLKAAELTGPDIPFKFVGDGPLRSEVEATARGRSNISLEPWSDRAQVNELLAHARLLVAPSVWFEGFPMVALEAFAAGVPMLASKIGAYEEIIRDAVTGFHFQPGDAQELADRISRLWKQPQLLASVAGNARTEFNEKYSPERNLRSLEEIYQSTISKHRMAAVRSH